MKNQTDSLPVPAVFQLEAKLVSALLTVDGPAFARWRKADAKAKAAKKEADTLRMVCGFPSTEELVALLGAQPEGEARSGVIVDGNSVPVGKLSVFWRAAFETKAGFQSRIS